MTTLRLVGFSLVVLVVTASALGAQTPPAPSQEPDIRLSLVIEPQLIRFTTPGAALEWRLEISNAQGETIFDSGFANGKEVDWPLVRSDAPGQAVESGLYSYTVTIRGAGSETRIQHGQLQIERVRSVYQIASLSSDPVGAVTLSVIDAGEPPAAPSESASRARSEGSGTTVAATPEMFRRSLSSVSFAPQPLISGSGTTSAMTKWTDGPSGVVGDTNVTEANGSVVVGNGTFRGNVHIFGPADKDVFAGMGQNLIAGPGFNYGYAGESFGRSAGFFNVRPDVSAIAPNPSLRFMTANAQRMIITNLGKVGIGTLTPNHLVRIAGGPLWTANGWYGSLELDNAAAIGWQPNGAGYSGGIGHTDGGMYFFNSLSAPADGANAADYQMFITDDGKVGIGTTSPTYKVQVAGAVSASGLYSSSGGIGVSGQSTGSGQPGVYGTSNSGTGVSGNSTSGYGVYGSSVSNYAGFFAGNVFVIGTVTQTSDVRLKRDVVNLRYGLLEVLQLRPVTWTWKDHPDRGRQLGLIAQDVEPVIPELVTREKDEPQTLGLNYIGLMPVVINAIQEQQATIRALQAENAALKTRLVAIEQALASMGQTRQKN